MPRVSLARTLPKINRRSGVVPRRLGDATVRLKDDAANTGKYLDHEDVTFGSAPTSRLRPRVQLAGANAGDIAPITTRGVPIFAPDKLASGTLNAVATGTNDGVILDLEGVAQPVCKLTGTLANAATVVMFQYDPGTGVWEDMQCMHLSNTGTVVLRYVVAATLGLTVFNQGIYKPLGITGMKRVRAVMTARGGADSVTATWHASYAQPDVFYAAICGDITDDGLDDNGLTVDSPPVKFGGRAIVGWPPSKTHGKRINAHFDFWGRQVGFIDQRIASTIEKYMLAVSLSGVASANTVIAGIRKLNANPTARITKLRVTPYNVAALTAGVPIEVIRATSVAGGSLVAVADIPKKNTVAGNATLEVRTGAATGTPANRPMLGYGAQSSLTAGAGQTSDEWNAGLDFSERIVLTGDEGLLIRQVGTSDTDQRWLLTLEWEEDF